MFDSETFGALASAKRLQILEWLKDPEAHFPPQRDGDLRKDGVCVIFIADKLGVAQPTATAHLKTLARAGLVTSKRMAGWTFYKRDEKAIAALKRAIENHPGQIAAIITEGIMANMGVIPPAKGYLQGLQDLARAHGILFILDETVTGFRIAPGGCQEYYRLSPDLVTFGKALGCGLPVAALAGRAEVMDALQWGGVLHYGTHNGSRIGMYAARANLRVLTRDNNASFRHTWRIAERLCKGYTELFEKKGIAAVVQNVGPMFQVMFTERPAIRDYREFCQFVDRSAFQRFVLALFPFGVYASPSAALHSIVTLAHTEEDVDRTLAAAEKASEKSSE